MTGYPLPASEYKPFIYDFRRGLVQKEDKPQTFYDYTIYKNMYQYWDANRKKDRFMPQNIWKQALRRAQAIQLLEKPTKKEQNFRKLVDDIIDITNQQSIVKYNAIYDMAKELKDLNKANYKKLEEQLKKRTDLTNDQKKLLLRKFRLKHGLILKSEANKK